MVSVFRSAIAGCSVAGIVWLAMPGQPHAAEALPSPLQTQVLNLLEASTLDDNHCIPRDRVSELIRSYPQLTQEIVEFASAKLAWKRNRLRDDCSCPTDLAIATIRVVPEFAGPIRRVLEDRYPECQSALETAMEGTLGEIAPGAGSGGPSSDPKFPGLRPTEETCRDTSAPGCGFIQQPPNTSASPSQRSGMEGNSGAEGALAGGNLPPEVQAQVLEVLDANRQQQEQCIAANALTTLVGAYPDLALDILEFASVELPLKRRILRDECTCPIELVVATVRAVPELAGPARRVMEDRYPECDQGVEAAMAEALANLEPSAPGGDRYDPDYPGLTPTEEICRDTSSPSCGFVSDPPNNSASPSSLR